MIKRVPVVERIMSANDQIASENHKLLNDFRVFSMNFMASPGAGKTSLIELTVKELANNWELSVIDGDIATSIDADRASAAGAQAIQVNTGGECHLDAVMVRSAIQQIDLGLTDLLIVENVGNLICPASFELGTHINVLISSIPEGDDKPYKYPQMYQHIDALVINKIDLLPYVDFNLEYFLKGVEILNPGLLNFQISCRTKEGIKNWTRWVAENVTSFTGEELITHL